ncbi:MAG: hypothetical protein GPJ21_01035 [Microcystis aeruginosa W13-11]|jgi:hypothetical protein|nr:hypothetical protein [Microcystis aeruginosa W13-11]
MSQLIAVSLLFLVGCSENSTDRESSNNSSPIQETVQTPDSSSNIESPQWSYEVFNSGIGNIASSQVVGGPIFDQQNRQVEWVVEYSLVLPDNATPVEAQVAQSLLNVELSTDFKAEFEDKNGVILGTELLWKEGEGNRKRYTLRIPNRIWQRWSEVSRINLAR